MLKRLYTRRELLAILVGAGLAGVGSTVRGTVFSPGSNRVATARIPNTVKPDIKLLGSLIDRSIMEVVGARKPADAWRSLFSPEDHLSIKVNCLGGPAMSTNPLLVLSIIERLKMCGIKERRIIIWDRSSRELEEAGYKLSKGGSGIQCYGTDEVGYGNTLYEKDSVASLFSKILTDRCNKIINVPILKDHGICGITFAMKNHFGAIHNPNKFHLNRCNPYIADLNSMKLIRERETLIIGDLTRIQADGGPSYKSRWAVPYNGVLVGRDPVATDSVALAILQQARRNLGRPDFVSKGIQPDYIDKAGELGVGKSEGMEHIELSL